ncbi:MAG: rhodanese-like domain-containing protein [Bacteroidia bacterium]
MKNERIIVDVRSPEEWEFDGHSECAVNFPLNNLLSHIDEIKKYNEVILVCRSGGRADVAKQILMSQGVKNVQNLGPWQNASCN